MGFFVSSSNPKAEISVAPRRGRGVSITRAGRRGSREAWHAYLSTSTVDAKTRIGNGPWNDFKGGRIARTSRTCRPDNKISAATSLTEKGTTPNYLAVNRPGDARCATAAARHPDGNKRGRHKNADTCKDWTVGNADAKAMLGHADRLGRNAGVNSWNAVHASQAAAWSTAPTGGAGLLYCSRPTKNSGLAAR